jgi:PAS domain S-box-containing protein
VRRSPPGYAYRDRGYRELPDTGWHLGPDVAWASFDRVGRITAANRLLELLVSDGEPIVGHQISEFMQPENVELQARQFEAVLRGETLHSIGRGPRADGREMLLEYVGRLVADQVHGWYREAVGFRV